MARNKKAEETAEVAVEETAEVAVEETAEERLLKEALSAEDHVFALTSLRSSEECSSTLNTMVGTFLALLKALGEDATATQYALENLTGFKSVKVKAKKDKQKVPKFDEAAELKKVMAQETPDFTELLVKASEKLKVTITTYTTLLAIEGIDQSLVDNAKAMLVNFGTKSRRKSGGTHTEEFNVKYNGIVYKNLAAAIYASGYSKDKLNDKKQREADVAWRMVRPKILEAKIGESVEYQGKEYIKVEPTALAIGGTRGRQKKEPEEKVVEGYN